MNLILLDLDNISQADNGAQLSTGEADLSDTESEGSQKDDDIDADPVETTYVPNTEDEEFGESGAQVSSMLRSSCRIIKFNLR